MVLSLAWRGAFDNAEVNRLHAEAFGTRVYDDAEWDWQALVSNHSLGWVVARDDDRLVGFVNVVWDGLVHAWLQDTMVASDARRRGVATQLVVVARDQAAEAGCEWLHVDFEPELRELYLGACGFTPVEAGLLALVRPTDVPEAPPGPAPPPAPGPPLLPNQSTDQGRSIRP
jgi:GNAT superfamily N-acetyltransferase